MTIEKTKEWFSLAIPNPTYNNQIVQLGVHLEEVLEMLEAIEIENGYVPLDDLKEALQTVATSLKTNKEMKLIVRDRKEFLDGLTDQVVTATGCGHMFGMDVPGALGQVNDSNWSKFVDGKPIFNEHGKIAKGPSYFKPKLDSFLGEDPVQN